MTPEERSRFDELCKKVQIEQDRETFDQYVRELNDLLDSEERRFKEEAKKNPLLRPPVPK
jgi:hypothetical protein